MANTRKTSATNKARSARGDEAVSKIERLIYVGPNLPGGRLLSGQVFKGGYPPYLEDVFNETPEVKQLFFPVDRVMEVQKKLKEPGSNEARLFSIAKQKLGVR